MPRRLAMSTLIERCQRRSDKEGDPHISDAEWRALISEAYGELFNAVAGTGLRYFELATTFTADGSESYDEPTSILSTVAVREITNTTTGARRELQELMMPETSDWAGLTGPAQVYVFVDDQLYLYPRPSSGTYEIAYIPQSTDLSDYATDDVVDVVTPDGEAFLIWGVAVKALAKSQHDVSHAIAEREAARGRLTEWAVLRAFNAPRRRPDPALSDIYTDPADWRYR